MSLNKSHQIHPTYRADIDGLRAIAVLSVVGFHAFPSLITGGFIGVDIFFVISGYLISKILFSNLEQDRFSIVEFYRRRVLRIFPALLAVMLACLAVGWYVLLSDEYAQLGKHIAGGSTFLSNIFLWSESGYFDNTAETKPMLHLWSLAIEEQFYLLWPLMLAFVWKRKWNFLGITAAVAFLSFFSNIYLTASNPTAAFYLPISRFWELMIGGVLAYISLHREEMIRKHKNAQSLLGFFLLAAGLVFINKDRLFPSWWALLPTFGAFFIIAAGNDAWLNKRILSNKLVVWVGLISYPLYLWHWPLLSFAHITEGSVSRLGRVTLVFASVALAWLTYRFIERPIRYGDAGRFRPLSLVSMMVAVGLVGLSVKLLGGLDGYGVRSPEKSAFSKYFDQSGKDANFFAVEKMDLRLLHKCNFGSTKNRPIAAECYTRDLSFSKSVFIWGDSHAQTLNYGLSKWLPKEWQILQVASSGCVANVNAEQSKTDYCATSNWFAYKQIAETKPDVVIISQNENHDVNNMMRISEKLESVGVKKIIFVGPTPHWAPDLPKLVLRKLWDNTPNRTTVGVNDLTIKNNESLKRDFKETEVRKFVSVIDYFCNAQGCVTYIGNDKKTGLTAWDSGHITPIASDFFARDVLAPLVEGQPGSRTVVFGNAPNAPSQTPM